MIDEWLTWTKIRLLPKNRRFSALAVLILLALAAAGWALRPAPTPPSGVEKGFPPAAPVQSRNAARLKWGSLFRPRTTPISLPAGQLHGADWFLPMAPDSSLAFILHDREARWQVAGQTRTLNDVPANPDGIRHGPEGRSLAWATGTGVILHPSLASPPRNIAKATAPYFTREGQLQYLVPSGSNITVRGPFPAVTLSNPGQTGPEPFIANGTRLITDRAGALLNWPLAPEAKPAAIARVNPKLWPRLIASGTVGRGFYLLLSNPTATPAYLLLFDSGSHVWWVRWHSPLLPEVKPWGQDLVVSRLDPKGRLAIIAGGQIRPITVSDGLFSAGPDGVVFQNGGKFYRIRPESPSTSAFNSRK